MAQTRSQCFQALGCLPAPADKACRVPSSVSILGNCTKGLKLPALRAASNAQRPRQASLAVRGDGNAVAEPAAFPPPDTQPANPQPAPGSHSLLASVELPFSIPPESKIIEADFIDSNIGSATSGAASNSEVPTGAADVADQRAPAEEHEESVSKSTSAADVRSEDSSAAQVRSSPDGSLPTSDDGSAKAGYYAPVLELLAAAKVVPHPAKVAKGGEDAYLISDVGAGVLCVADGVGGWANDGVDPALYSKELVYHMQTAVEAAECQEDLEPREIIRMAHTATKAEGAATAVVAVFDGERSALDVANLGDSGVLIVRKGEVLFKTDHQQHYFDCPFQLGSESSDSPDDAQLYSVDLVEGDTVVMGSDGLFDNVFDKDVACVVKVFGGQDSVAVQRMATALATLASKHAADPEYMSPYIVEAVECGRDLPVWEKMLGRKLSGGKLDDITVVVAQVVKSSLGEETEGP